MSMIDESVFLVTVLAPLKGFTDVMSKIFTQVKSALGKFHNEVVPKKVKKRERRAWILAYILFLRHNLDHAQ